jgi:hypothetical protein
MEESPRKKSECSQRIPALCGVSSISSICSAIEKYKPSIFQKHIQTDIKYIIIYMYYDISISYFLSSTTHGENGGNSLNVRNPLIILNILV